MMAAPLNGLTIAAAQTMLALLRQRHTIEPFEVRDADDIRSWYCAHDGIKINVYHGIGYPHGHYVHDTDNIRELTSIARRV